MPGGRRRGTNRSAPGRMRRGVPTAGRNRVSSDGRDQPAVILALFGTFARNRKRPGRGCLVSLVSEIVCAERDIERKTKYKRKRRESRQRERENDTLTRDRNTQREKSEESQRESSKQKIRERDESHVRERERENDTLTGRERTKRERERERERSKQKVRPTGFEPAQLTLLAILPIPKDKT